VFAALAVARHLQDATDVTIRKLVRTLRPLRTVTIAIGGTSPAVAPVVVRVNAWPLSGVGSLTVVL